VLAGEILKLLQFPKDSEIGVGAEDAFQLGPAPETSTKSQARGTLIKAVSNANDKSGDLAKAGSGRDSS
jgi:hypothetical protein